MAKDPRLICIIIKKEPSQSSMLSDNDDSESCVDAPRRPSDNCCHRSWEVVKYTAAALLILAGFWALLWFLSHGKSFRSWHPFGE